jgi:hypothetical protein
MKDTIRYKLFLRLGPEGMIQMADYIETSQKITILIINYIWLHKIFLYAFISKGRAFRFCGLISTKHGSESRAPHDNFNGLISTKYSTKGREPHVLTIIYSTAQL